jgi:hypothetical protein
MSLTIGIGKEGIGLIFPFFLLAQRKRKRHKEAERRAKHEAKHEAKRMLGDRYERTEGNGKAPVDLEEYFMQVIYDMLSSQRTMYRSLAQVVDRLARVGTPETQVLHVEQGNSRESSRPHPPSCTYTSRSRIPITLFPSF